MREGIILEITEQTATIITPDGDFLAIPAKLNWQLGDKVRFTELTEKKARQSKKLFKKRPFLLDMKKTAITLVASLLLLLLPLSLTSEASTVITLDINPSVELKLQGSEVVKAKALNPDGEILLAEMQLTKKINQSLENFTSILIDKALELGFLNLEDENIIMIGILDNKDNFQSTEYEKILQEKLADTSLSAELLVLTATKEEKKAADQKDISLGKYLLQKEQEKAGIILSDQQLKEESVKELIEEIKLEKEKQDKEKVEKEKPEQEKPEKENKNENEEPGKNDQDKEKQQNDSSKPVTPNDTDNPADNPKKEQGKNNAPEKSPNSDKNDEKNNDKNIAKKENNGNNSDNGNNKKD